MSENLLVSENLTKNYGSFLALDNFSCEVPHGVTGLLGPNGAGKTTFIRSILGIHPIQSGLIYFENWTLPKNITKARDYIGYQPEVPTRLKQTSAMRYVTHMCKMAGLPRNASIQRAFDTLHYVGLEEARYRNMETFSQGMLQKVKLATALVHDPILLILDEPTAGCDPVSREQILSLIDDLGKNYNMNILISTHLLPDVERTSNYVVVMSHGKNVIQGNLNAILKRTGETIKLDISVTGDHFQFSKILESNNYDILETTETLVSCLISENDTDKYSKVFELAKNQGMAVRMISPYRNSLEDVFLEVINGGKIDG